VLTFPNKHLNSPLLKSFISVYVCRFAPTRLPCLSRLCSSSFFEQPWAFMGYGVLAVSGGALRVFFSSLLSHIPHACGERISQGWRTAISKHLRSVPLTDSQQAYNCARPKEGGEKAANRSRTVKTTLEAQTQCQGCSSEKNLSRRAQGSHGGEEAHRDRPNEGLRSTLGATRPGRGVGAACHHTTRTWGPMRRARACALSPASAVPVSGLRPGSPV
jgi:hypothetical protein